VNHVYEPEQFESEVMDMARHIAAANPLTVSLTKRSVDSGLETTREGAMAVELLAIQENLRHGDWKKAIADFGKKEAGNATTG
jgi:enoyl-CoA hydratase